MILVVVPKEERVEIIMLMVPTLVLTSSVE